MVLCGNKSSIDFAVDGVTALYLIAFSKHQSNRGKATRIPTLGSNDWIPSVITKQACAPEKGGDFPRVSRTGIGRRKK